MTFVDELVAESHDIVVHAVLKSELRDSLRMSVGESLEKTDIESSSTSFGIANLFQRRATMSECPEPAAKGRAHERGKLIVITDEDKLVGETKRSNAGWKRDL